VRAGHGTAMTMHDDTTGTRMLLEKAGWLEKASLGCG
jgi:hypothetical protein